LGTVTIFDERGRIIRSLYKNQLLGTEGTLTWDGVKDDQTKASIGVYVVLFEAFNLDGSIIFAKRKAITLAGKI
jgi:flagellar hook assembly protein FlgD